MRVNVRPSPCQTPLATVSRRAAVRRQARRAVLVRAEENIFQQLGTQLRKAGSQLTGTVQTFGGRGKGLKRDEDVIFVAGATGRLGARIVKECLAKGFTVRAGVRSMEKGQQLIETGKQYGVLSAAELSKLELVEYDLFDEASIGPAIGNAGRVVCAIGAAEDKPFDTKAPQKVDGEAAISLIQASARLNVSQFIMVTSLGTTKFGWPASVLNLFWGVLYWKKQAEEALQLSGMPYTIVRPGGMERPTDQFKETHNVVLTPRDQLFGGQVSRLQVAEVIATCLSSRTLAENKVLEIVAETTAPLESYEDLLEGVVQEISVQEVNEKRAEIADARNSAGLLNSEIEELEAMLVEAEERKIRANEAFNDARGSLQSVSKEAGLALKAADSMQSQMDSLSSQLDKARREEAAAKAVLDAQRRNQRTLEILDSRAIQEIVQPIMNPGSGGSRSTRGGGSGFSLFGFGAKPAAAQEVEEEDEEEEEEQAPAPKRGGFSLFGKPAPKAVQEVEELEEEEEEEEVAQPVKRAPAFSFFGKKAEAAAEEAEEVVEEVVEEVQQKTSKGGGFFGMFQQDTVQAEDQPGAFATGSSDSVAPPSLEQIDRAVTKRGRGPPPGRASIRDLKKNAQNAKKEVVESVAPVANGAVGVAREAKAAAPAVEKVAKTILNDATAAAPKVEKVAAKVEKVAEKAVKKVEAKAPAQAPVSADDGVAANVAEADQWIAKYKAKNRVKVNA